MNHKGVVSLLLMFVALVTIITSAIIFNNYINKTEKITEDTEKRSFIPDFFTNSGKDNPEASLSPTQTTKPITTLQPNSNTDTTIVNTTPPPNIPTSIPTSTPPPETVLPPSTCSVNNIANESNPYAINFNPSASSQRGTHIAAVQWDFNGDGNWDTDMSINNQNITHTFPQGGTYNVRVKLTMSDGEVTSVCAKNVTVPQGTTLTLTGYTYEDKNCNDMREPDEAGVPNVTINLFWMPDFYVYATISSDSNGYYSYSKNTDSYISLQPSHVAPSYYKIHASSHTVTLNGAYPSANINLPLVPAVNIGSCN